MSVNGIYGYNYNPTTNEFNVINNPYNVDLNQQDASVFDVSENTGNTCTDGNDDGKVGFFAGLGSFIKGVFKPIKEAIKHPIKTALAIAGGAALIAVTGGAATPFLIAGGIGLGAIQLGKGLYGAATAKTDAQKKDALENMGTGTFTLASSAYAAKTYMKHTAQTIKPNNDAPQLPPPKNGAPQLPPKGAEVHQAPINQTGAAPNPTAGTSAPPKWDANSIKVAMENASKTGNVKKVYRDIALDIHPDTATVQYVDAGELMTYLQQLKLQYAA
ncbi:MAG: hypothetical protein E7Z91_02740 [Cyanobacteria bacterium SIG30]|nr:hypothetical protein [Cyanobacteria bacterium SIG30]